MPRKPFSHEEFIESAKESLSMYDVIGEYVNKRTKILVKCKKCGYERMINPQDLKSKAGCTYCGKLKRDRDCKLFSDEFYKINDNHEMIGNFNGIMNDVSVRCMKCNNTRNVKAKNAIKYKLSCIKCCRSKDEKEVVKDIYKLVGDEYELISNYEKDSVNVVLLHNECGHKWNVRMSSFNAGTRCPKCRNSKGEKKIAMLLDDNCIKYEKEFTFDDLIGVGGGKLRYDFAIIGKRRGVKMLIEYDGELHYSKYSIGNNLEKQLIHDNIKSEYAKKKKIPLLRIPYWEYDNINNILNNKLGEFINENK